MVTNRKKVILDVDTGVDDALAILAAVQSDELELIGVTTCFGNVDVDTATRNTLAVLELAGRPDIPVYRGAQRPLLREWQGAVPWIHGDNGLGDAPLPNPRRGAEAETAMQYLHRILQQFPQQVTLIPVARMTNLASLYLYDPDVLRQAERVVLMGGAAFCPGNVSAVAEANIWGDPEAAQILFRTGLPLTMVGLDVTMQARLSQSQLQTLTDGPCAAMLRQAIGFYIGAYQQSQGQEVADPWCALHDPLAVAMVADPTLCRTERYAVDVETGGLLTAGMTVVDARRTPAHTTNTDVCVALDTERFLNWMAERIGFRA